MDSPSGRVPKQGLDWFLVSTEAYGGGTSDLGSPGGFLEYLGIYRAKRGCGSPRRWAQPTGVHLGAQARLGGLCPLGAPPRYCSGPLDVFWSIKNPQKVSLRSDSIWYRFPAM